MESELTRNRLHRRRRGSIVVGLLLAILAGSSESSGSGRFDDIQRLVRGRMAEERVPSLVVAVGRRGELLWQEGFGWADRENRIEATPHTPYSIASVTKPMTATGLMVLVEGGLVDLDRPVNDYLESAKLVARVGREEEATVRRVANHTSGLPMHYHFFPVDEEPRRPSMEETIRRYGQLVTPPGEIYEYSNLGYGVLEHVIERVSDRTLATFLATEVFARLGMADTFVLLEPAVEPRLAAVRYDREGEPLPFYDFDHRGASAVFSSAHDLVRFGSFHLGRPLPDQEGILTARSIREMQRETSLNREHGYGYGVGWQIWEGRKGHTVVGHTGGMGGVSSSLLLVPEVGLVVAVLANSRTRLVQEVARELLATLLPRRAGRTRAPMPHRSRHAGERASGSSKPKRRFRGSWRGSVHTYQGERSLTMTIDKASGLHARLAGEPERALLAVRFHRDTLRAFLRGDLRTDDANRRDYILRISLRLRGDRLTGAATTLCSPGPPLPNALSHWVDLRKMTSSPAGKGESSPEDLRPDDR